MGSVVDVDVEEAGVDGPVELGCVVGAKVGMVMGEPPPDVCPGAVVVDVEPLLPEPPEYVNCQVPEAQYLGVVAWTT